MIYRRPWTEAELTEFRRRYPDEKTQTIADDIGRPVTSCYGKAQALGLRKSESFFAGPDSGRTDGSRGLSSRFPKGGTSWNKGKHFEAGGRSTETRFKPGQMPHNHVPIGSERITSDGIRQRKVSESGYPPKDWQSCHSIMWVENNGPIPKNHVVVFKDSDRTNIVPGNLECISRGELMKRNTVHNLPKELANLVQLRGALTRQINKRERNEERN